MTSPDTITSPIHLRSQQAIPATLMRGGTSKGVFLHARDLPDQKALRDRVILSIMGSPDARQIDGLGGADPLTSKVAIIARSARPEADVDYTVGYVGIAEGVVDYEGNCGNLSQAVGPFAIDEGLVPANEPVTEVRIFNTNTKRLMVAEVPIADGRAATDGDFAVHGVPGTGARIVVNFIDPAGSKTGRLLPTGRVRDEIQLANGTRLEASLVDAAAPAVFVRARDIGFRGTEIPSDIEPNAALIETMQEIRAQAALMMQLAPDADHVSPAVPKVGIVASPQDYETLTGQRVRASECDVVARTLALGVMHKAYAMTGGICLSTAACIEGTVVHDVTASGGNGTVRIGHPSGVTSYVVSVENRDGEPVLLRAAVAGTARRIMDGHVYVPSLMLDRSGAQ